MKKYGQFTTFQTAEDKTDELENILLQASKEVCTAKGCNQYTVGRDTQGENTIHVFEVWDTKEDHDQSLNSDQTKGLIGKAIPLLAGGPQSVVIEIVE